MSHTIRYRRPEAPWNLIKMIVPTEAETAAQEARLKALGYTVVDISPPLSGNPKNDLKIELPTAFPDPGKSL